MSKVEKAGRDVEKSIEMLKTTRAELNKLPVITDAVRYLVKGAAAGVSEGMRSCVEAAANDAAKAACKQSSGKAALASSLGKDVSQVDDVELENFVKDGAVDQFAAAMDACAEAATTAAEKAACVDGPAAEAMA